MIPSLRRAAMVLCLLAGGLVPAAATDLTGTWLTQNGDARIRVARCGASLCGTIVWLRDVIDPATGQPPVDSKNPDPRRQGRKILGLQIFAMAPEAGGAYAGGIYNADDGQTYRGKISLRGAGQLEVEGCAGPLCGSETWSRAGR